MVVDVVLLVVLLALCHWRWLQNLYLSVTSLGRVLSCGDLSNMANDILQVVMAMTALMSLAFLCFIACIMAFGIWMLKNVISAYLVVFRHAHVSGLRTPF